MPNLKDITGIINNTLKQGCFASQKFSAGRYLAIADGIKTTGEGGDTMRPVIIDNDGKCTDIAVDDKYPFTIYHKVDDLESEPDDYGDPNTYMKETASMRLVFLGDRRKLKLPAEEIASFISAWIPRDFNKSLADLNLTSASLEVRSFDTDPYQVWRKEFEGLPEKFKPFNILLSIPYRIVSTFNNKCYTIC